jgi:hypothetical protein
MVIFDQSDVWGGRTPSVVPEWLLDSVTENLEAAKEKIMELIGCDETEAKGQMENVKFCVVDDLEGLDVPKLAAFVGCEVQELQDRLEFSEGTWIVAGPAGEMYFATMTSVSDVGADTVFIRDMAILPSWLYCELKRQLYG